MRSPTAEKIFARSEFLHARSRGLKSSANRRITADDITWAEVIFVMESKHKQLLLQRFGENVRSRVIFVLDIPDNYEFMDPELVELITSGVRGVLGEMDLRD